MKRALVALPVVVAAIILAYGLGVTRRERLYRQFVSQGDAAVSRGDTSEAIAQFTAAIALNSEAMLGHFKRGDARRRAGDLEAAARDLEAARALNPTEPRTVELLGDVAVARHAYDRADEYYTAYLQLDDQPRVYYKVGLARYLAGDHQRSIEALQHAIALDSRFAEAHYLLGACRQALKQPQAAQASFERALVLEPGLLAAREQLADLYGALGRRPERIRQLEELLAADAGASRQVILAVAYADAGQVARAIRMLRAAADFYPAHPEIYLALGRIWMSVATADGDRAAARKALEALQHAVAMQASGTALSLLGQARLLVSDAAAAERTLRQATAAFPTEPVSFLHLATAAERLGHAPIARRALVDYQKLTRAADPDFLVRLARAHWQAGDAHAARAALAAVLGRHPDHQSARDLERRLD